MRFSVASPCKARWESMAGDARARLCGQCSRHVYDFSQLTETEITALLVEKEGRVCARLYRRRDGTVLTADCPIGARLARRSWALVAAVVSLVVSGLALTGLWRWHRSCPTGGALLGEVEAAPLPKRD